MSINRALRHGQHAMDVWHYKDAGLFWNGKKRSGVFCSASLFKLKYRSIPFRFHAPYSILPAPVLLRDV